MALQDAVCEEGISRVKRPMCDLKAALRPFWSARLAVEPLLLLVVREKMPRKRLMSPVLASVACWWARRRLIRSWAGRQASSSCGCEAKVTERRIGICMYSAEGQLARGITGGKTESSRFGRIPEMLGVRDLLFVEAIGAGWEMLLVTVSSGLRCPCPASSEVDEEVVFEPVPRPDSSIRSSLRISASSAWISFL